MSEQTFDNENKGYVYAGRDAKGKPKFRKYTNEDLDYVKKYLDDKSIAYFVHEKQKLIFIYKEKEPKGRYSSRYSYYYSTGRWGDDRRRQHYHSEGVDHFINNYYKTKEEDIEYWSSKDD